jgi:hypothetical protein
METREKEIVARALEEVLSAWFDFTRSDRTFGQELEAHISALRRTPPSPQSGGAVELYRCVKVPVGPLYAFGEKYERATKAEAVCKAALMWADKPTPENTIALERAAGALGVDL